MLIPRIGNSKNRAVLYFSFTAKAIFVKIAQMHVLKCTKHQFIQLLTAKFKD